MLLVLVLPSIPAIPVGAQGTSTPIDPARDFDERIQSFFDQLKTGNTTVAFDNILLESPLGATTASGQISDMRARFEETKKNLFGEILSFERYGSKRIGEDIIVVRYILKCENYPMIWTFTFYRKPVSQTSLTSGSLGSGTTSVTNTNRWNLIEMRFDSNLDLLSL